MAAAFKCEADCDCYFCEAQRKLGKASSQGSSDHTTLDVFVANAAAQHASYLVKKGDEFGQDQARRLSAAVGSKVGAVVGYVEHSPSSVRTICVLVAFITLVVNLQELAQVRVYGQLLLEHGANFFRGKYSRTLRRYMQSESPVAALYNAYQAFFAFVTLFIEVDPKWQSKAGIQEWLHDQARFLTTRKGRGVFYVFQATLSFFQFRGHDLLCGCGMLLCAVLCFFGHTSRRPASRSRA